jgi:hypothetical protein
MAKRKSKRATMRNGGAAKVNPQAAANPRQLMDDVKNALQNGDPAALLQNPAFMQALQQHPQLLLQILQHNPAVQRAFEQAAPQLVEKLREGDNQQALQNLQRLQHGLAIKKTSYLGASPMPTTPFAMG